MDFIKLGLRTIIGIALPGVIIVLVLAYIFLCLYHLEKGAMPALSWLKDSQFPSLLAVFALSYFFGSLMRLNSADNLDVKSGKAVRMQWLRLKSYSIWKKELGFTHSSRRSWRSVLGLTHKDLKDAAKIKKVIEKARDCVDAGIITGETIRILTEAEEKVKAQVDSWIWRFESFPYPIWQFRKFKLYHPPNVRRFYWPYRRQMGFYSERHGKEFFNYCKASIYNAVDGSDNPLLNEVYHAEALVRYFSGIFYALFYSSILFLLLISYQVFVILGDLFDKSTDGTHHIFLVTSALILISMRLMCRGIKARFRTLRLKEVDTVYDAYYLLNSDKSQNDDLAKKGGIRAKRTRLIEQSYERENESLNLDALIRNMKVAGAQDPALASMYFAGALNDHPFFLDSDDVAIGISVLPEDAEKAAVAKRHPHQSEVIFVLKGEIEIKSGADMTSQKLKQWEVRVIEKNECHSIHAVKEEAATFLFVKTNPAEEPMGQNC